MRAENARYHFDDHRSPIDCAEKRALLNVFLRPEPEWRASVLGNGRFVLACMLDSLFHPSDAAPAVGGAAEAATGTRASAASATGPAAAAVGATAAEVGGASEGADGGDEAEPLVGMISHEGVEVVEEGPVKRASPARHRVPTSD